MTLKELSELPQDAFTRQLDAIFEHSPWIPQRAWQARPFADLPALHRAMMDVVLQASPEEQRALICAHPELAGREADAGMLTQASAGEQRGAGLDQCSAEELQRLRTLNARYRARFGFPFVIAVKGRDRGQILAAMEARLNHDPATEHAACLEQIGQIALFRLQALLNA